MITFLTMNMHQELKFKFVGISVQTCPNPDHTNILYQSLVQIHARSDSGTGFESVVILYQFWYRMFKHANSGTEYLNVSILVQNILNRKILNNMNESWFKTGIQVSVPVLAYPTKKLQFKDRIALGPSKFDISGTGRASIIFNLEINDTLGRENLSLLINNFAIIRHCYP